MGKELSNVVYFCDRPDEYPTKVLNRLKENKEVYEKMLGYFDLELKYDLVPSNLKTEL